RRPASLAATAKFLRMLLRANSAASLIFFKSTDSIDSSTPTDMTLPVLAFFSIDRLTPDHASATRSVIDPGAFCFITNNPAFCAINPSVIIVCRYDCKGYRPRWYTDLPTNPKALFDHSI